MVFEGRTYVMNIHKVFLSCVNDDQLWDQHMNIYFVFVRGFSQHTLTPYTDRDFKGYLQQQHLVHFVQFQNCQTYPSPCWKHQNKWPMSHTFCSIADACGRENIFASSGKTISSEKSYVIRRLQIHTRSRFPLNIFRAHLQRKNFSLGEIVVVKEIIPI